MKNDNIRYISRSIVNLTTRLTLDVIEARKDGLYLLDSEENSTCGIGLNDTSHYARKLLRAGFANLKIKGRTARDVRVLLKTLNGGATKKISPSTCIKKLDLEYNIDMPESPPSHMGTLLFFKEESSKKKRSVPNKRILYFVKTQVLAHISRTLEIAKRLKRLGYEIIFAGREAYNKKSYINLIIDAGFDFVKMIDIDREYFMKLYKKGKFNYLDSEAIRVFVDEQLRLINEINPIAVVSDASRTARIAAKLAGLPYISTTNANWTIYSAAELRFPDNRMWMKIVRSILHFEKNRRRAEKVLLSLVCPWYLKTWSRPYLEFIKEKGVPEDWLRPDYREVYGSDDLLLFLDTEDFAPTSEDRPDYAHYVGPIVFNPKGDLPAGWRKRLLKGKREGKITVYFTMGSTGPEERFGIFSDLDRLDKLGTKIMKKSKFKGEFKKGFLDKFQYIVSGKGVERLHNPDRGIFAAKFVPGLKAAGFSDVVVFHGGYQTLFQVLAAGKPMIVLPQWWDQEYTLHWARKKGIGDGLFPREFSLNKFLKKLIEVTTNQNYNQEAIKVKELLKSYPNPPQRAAELIHQFLKEDAYISVLSAAL